jgi:hypothetical protein
MMLEVELSARKSGRYREADEESLEVRLFDEADVPWDEIAFPTVSQTLRFFFADRETGDYGIHTSDIFRSLRNG